jgi:hypothetical protein
MVCLSVHTFNCSRHTATVTGGQSASSQVRVCMHWQPMCHLGNTSGRCSPAWDVACTARPGPGSRRSTCTACLAHTHTHTHNVTVSDYQACMQAACHVVHPPWVPVVLPDSHQTQQRCRPGADPKLQSAAAADCGVSVTQQQQAAR